MIERLLVPLDGSSAAESILPLVRLLALGLGQPVELLMVIPPLGDLHPAQSDLDTELTMIHEQRHEYAATYLDGLRARFEAAGVWASTVVATGVVAPTIVATAKQQQAGAVVMATHGRGGAIRWVLGSVADKVVRLSPVPVLLRRPQEETTRPWDGVRCILLPLDGSTLAAQAIPYASFLAQALRAKVIVIGTVGLEWITGPGPEVGHYASTALVGLVEGDLRSYIETRTDDLRASGIAAESHFVPFIDPATEISALAGRTPDSLVVMSTHGRTGLRRAVLGSVTDKVIRQAVAPVMVIPAVPEE